MRKHARTCWGEEVVKAADDAKSCDIARESIINGILTNGSITASFERKGKGKITYSHRQHTKTKTKAEIVRWVCESARPFDIVKDRAFQSLMKTGQPEYYIPSPSTISCDIKLVFAQTRQRIVKMLQVRMVLILLSQKNNKDSPGIQRTLEFCDQCLDFTQP
jgi:hypothetical protein